MAEFETTIDEVDDFETTTEEIDTPDEIDYDQAIEWKKKAERLDKAEKKLVELKKLIKEKPQETWDYITKDELEIEKFITRNPELEEYKEDLNKYKKLWLSLEKAKLLIENDDKTIENRKKTNSMNLTNWEESSKTTYNKSDLENMTQSEYNKIMALKEAWKIIIKK